MHHHRQQQNGRFQQNGVIAESVKIVSSQNGLAVLLLIELVQLSSLDYSMAVQGS